MEKNPTCVSTTPEEMYWELQAERKQILENAILGDMRISSNLKTTKYLLSVAQKGGLSRKQQLAVLKLPQAPEILLAQAENGGLHYDTQLKVFKLPNAQEIILELAKRRWLYHEAQLKVFELPNAQEIISILIEKKDLCDKATEKAHALGWL